LWDRSRAARRGDPTIPGDDKNSNIIKSSFREIGSENLTKRTEKPHGGVEERTELSPVSVQETLAPMARTRRGEEGPGIPEAALEVTAFGAPKRASGAMERLGRAAVYCGGTAAREATGEKGREGEEGGASQRKAAQRAWTRDS